MGFKDSLASMKQEAQDQLDKMASVQSDLQTKITSIDAMQSDIDAEMKKASDAGYEEGLKAAGQAGGSDKIYSDAQMNEFIAQAKADAAAALQPQIDQLNQAQKDSDSKLADLQSKLDAASSSTASAVADAEAKLKAQFVADYESVEVDNDAMIAKYKKAPATDGSAAPANS